LGHSSVAHHHVYPGTINMTKKQEPNRPNILFIMTDQQRWDAMGCSGGWIDTPNMDRIASSGVLFSNCVTTSPVCISARTSMATGLYPHNTGIWQNMEHTLPGGTRTWMQSIRAAGYRTSLFGKTHLHPHSGDLRDREHLMRAHGIDDVNEIGGPRASARVLSHMTATWQEMGLWDAYRDDYDERFSNKPHVVRPSTLPLDLYADVYVGQQAKSYLKDYRGQAPWFCWVSFGGPHEPWDTPAPYADRYNHESMPNPRPRPEDWPQRHRGSIDDKYVDAPVLAPGDCAAMRADYGGNVTLIDDQIGEIVEEVRKRGELENTVILLTSDHGEMNGDAGLIYKENFLDGAVRVPMVVSTPETRTSGVAGSISDTFVEWFDAGPTLVELAGGKFPGKQHAKSLVPVLQNPVAAHRTNCISEYRGETMLLNQNWKMAINAEKKPYLLFDRENDPDETENLAGRAGMEQSEYALLDELTEVLAATGAPQ